MKLEIGEDYQVESGSTRITIEAKTLTDSEGFVDSGDDSSGKTEHTIAMEFREGGETGELKRASQNYTTGGEEPAPAPETSTSPEPTATPAPSQAPAATPVPTDTDKVETQTDENGTTTVITTKPDGTVVTRDTDKSSNIKEVTKYPDGTVVTKYYMIDGTKTTTTEKPNGEVPAEVTLPKAVVEKAGKNPVELPMVEWPVYRDLKKAATVTRRVSSGSRQTASLTAPTRIARSPVRNSLS